MQQNRKMSFMIDVGTQLKIEIVGVENRLNCNLVGMKPDKYLIIETLPGDVFKLLSEGKTAIIRYLYFGNIFGFKSKILNLIGKPYNLIFLSYPKSVESHNLRKNARIHCHIPATATIQNSKISGVIMDISVSGCQYAISESKNVSAEIVKTEEPVQLVFPFFGMEGSQTVQATIRHVDNDDKRIMLGLRFEQLDAEILKALEHYIKNVCNQTS